MIIACCTRGRRVKINLRRVFLYITVIALLSSLFVNFIFRWLVSSYHHQQQKPTQGEDINGSGTVASSTSSSSTSLPCDEECRRFGRLLDAWPADKPKAAVVLLLQPSSVDTFTRSSHMFSANFNDAYGYPVIIFHEENMNSEADRQRLRSLTNSSLYFQVRCISSC